MGAGLGLYVISLKNCEENGGAMGFKKPEGGESRSQFRY